MTKTIVRKFIQEFVQRFGVPETITTDEVSQFESTLFDEMTKVLGCKRLRTTAYHPQANGLVERFHKQLKASLLSHGDTSK